MVTVDPEQIKTLREQGLTQQQIATTLGTSRSAVQRVVAAKAHKDNRAAVEPSTAIPRFVGVASSGRRGRETMTAKNSIPIKAGQSYTEPPPDMFGASFFNSSRTRMCSSACHSRTVMPSILANRSGWQLAARRYSMPFCGVTCSALWGLGSHSM